MCQCGCAEFPITKAYELPDGKVIGIGVYRGCQDCFAGLGYSVYVFPSREAGKEWLRSAEFEKYKPDEFGGNHGFGINLSLFEVSDLKKAYDEIGDPADSWDDFKDWLDENGLNLMQKAFEKFEAKCAEIKERLKGYDAELADRRDDV